ncbi:MAG: galactose-1-phosphate uridylyltransferase [Candidatus Thorarchaeota archaeon]
MSRIRRNIMLGEWVIVSPHRASRPFQDSSATCPFCPGQPETEGEWEVLTLSNRFAALTPDLGYFPLSNDIVMEAPPYGECRVVVHSRHHDRQFENMSIDEIERVMREYRRVFAELDTKEHIHYVLQFENRGRPIGVSLDHPHSQVYALPFIPPRIEREMNQSKVFWEREGECLLCDIIDKEMKSGDRVINQTDEFVSLVPFGARLPYEVHIYPLEHVGSLVEMEGRLRGLSTMIHDTTLRFSRVFDEVAYVMVFHCRPSAGEYPYWHFHIEFYPPWRDRRRMKYLAGIETGGWTYTNDSLPEEKARELREAI